MHTSYHLHSGTTTKLPFNISTTPKKPNVYYDQLLPIAGSPHTLPYPEELTVPTDLSIQGIYIKCK